VWNWVLGAVGYVTYSYFKRELPTETSAATTLTPEAATAATPP
jgi:hypothetical protein